MPVTRHSPLPKQSLNLQYVHRKANPDFAARLAPCQEKIGRVLQLRRKYAWKLLILSHQSKQKLDFRLEIYNKFCQLTPFLHFLYILCDVLYLKT